MRAENGRSRAGGGHRFNQDIGSIGGGRATLNELANGSSQLPRPLPAVLGANIGVNKDGAVSVGEMRAWLTDRADLG